MITRKTTLLPPPPMMEGRTQKKVSNKRHGTVKTLSGVPGLGCCLACCNEAREADDGAPQKTPEMAITMAPSIVQLPQYNSVSVVAVPTCWTHLQPSGDGPPRRPLLVPGGG